MQTTNASNELFAHYRPLLYRYKTEGKQIYSAPTTLQAMVMLNRDDGDNKWEVIIVKRYLTNT